MPRVLVDNQELSTVRDARRSLSSMVDDLEMGEREKVVLTQRGQMRAVIVSLERYAELEALERERGVGPPLRDAA